MTMFDMSLAECVRFADAARGQLGVAMLVGCVAGFVLGWFARA